MMLLGRVVLSPRLEKQRLLGQIRHCSHVRRGKHVKCGKLEAVEAAFR